MTVFIRTVLHLDHFDMCVCKGNLIKSHNFDSSLPQFTETQSDKLYSLWHFGQTAYSVIPCSILIIFLTVYIDLGILFEINLNTILSCAKLAKYTNSSRTNIRKADIARSETLYVN